MNAMKYSALSLVYSAISASVCCKFTKKIMKGEIERRKISMVISNRSALKAFGMGELGCEARFSFFMPCMGRTEVT